MKRSHESADGLQDAEYQRPNKLRKHNSNHARVQEALEEIEKKLQHGGGRGMIFSSLKKHPELEKQILEFQVAIRAAIQGATPFDPAAVVKRAQYQLDYDNHEFYGDMEESNGSARVEKAIVKAVDEDILQRIDSESAYDTKLAALSAVVDIIATVSPMQDGTEWAGNFQTGSLPRTLVAGLLRLGNLMTDEEIDLLIEEKHTFVKLDIAKKAEYLCWKPWRCITQFLNLCTDDSKVLKFNEALEEVQVVIDEVPSTSKESHRGYDGPESWETGVLSILEGKISWKIHLRSAYQTKLNAFKVLTGIGRAVVWAQKGPHADAFQNAALETTITDIMLKICEFTNQGFAASSYESYLVDQKFVSDILDLNVERKSAFPDLPLVLQELKIFGEDSEDEPGSEADSGLTPRT